jgi:hypothetical protein
MTTNGNGPRNATWDEYLAGNCRVPDEAGEILMTMTQEQVGCLMASVIHFIDCTCVAYDSFPDVSDKQVKIVDGFVDGLRQFVEEVSETDG